MSETEIINGNEVRERIEFLANSIDKHAASIEMDYVMLGKELMVVQGGRLWREWGYTSFAAYLNYLYPRVKKGRAQLYAAVRAVEKLLPQIAEADLKEIGLTKASELAKAVDRGTEITDELVTKSKELSCAELEAELFGRENPPEEKEVYWKMAAFLSPEELKEVQDAFKIACAIEQIGDTLPDHIKHKKILLALCRNFIGTMGAMVKNGSA